VVAATLTDYTPKKGSIYGGTLITITGTNFGTEKTDNPVQINLGDTGVDCKVITTQATEITCRVDESSFAQKKIADAVANNAEPKLVVFLKTSEEAKCVGNHLCEFLFTDTLPEVTQVASEISGEDIIVSLTGTGFTAGDI